MNERSYDVVIIGSGAGGGTVAQQLGTMAHAGVRILVVEQGARYRDSDFNGWELDMVPPLYQDGGAFITEEGTVTLAFGRCYGGSTVVMTGTSLIPPARVMEHWDIPGLTAVEMEARCRKFMAQHNVHLLEDDLINENNRLFFEGCRKLGYPVEQFPINVRGCRGTGLCNLGCPSGAKMGTHRVQLPEAERNGVEVVTRAEALRIEDRAVVVRVSQKLPAEPGAPPEWAPGDYRVRAKIVVAAGGSVGSTALLLRSRLAGAWPRLGCGFTCHPAQIVVGQHSRAIGNMAGFPKSYCVDRAAEEGFLIETCMYFPFVTAKSLVGFGRGHATMLQDFTRLQMILVLACDRAIPDNRIVVDAAGRPKVHYRFTAELKQAAVLGARAAARVLFAAGAERVHVPFADPPLVEKALADEIDTAVAVRHFKEGKVVLSAAHPMGGCGMGRFPADSVTDAWGVVHGLPWLRVADSSLFPDSLEVNPYLAVMSLADRVSEGIRRDAGALFESAPAREGGTR
jgi:choline dehydrogenase-like flavoprotein